MMRLASVAKVGSSEISPQSNEGTSEAKKELEKEKGKNLEFGSIGARKRGAHPGAGYGKDHHLPKLHLDF